jgi:hypothetical protein
MLRAFFAARLTRTFAMGPTNTARFLRAASRTAGSHDFETVEVCGTAGLGVRSGLGVISMGRGVLGAGTF